MYSGNGAACRLAVVGLQSMNPDVAANAVALPGGHSAAGHVELSGIFFDSGMSEVMPESEPALRDVAKLLQGSPALKV